MISNSSLLRIMIRLEKVKKILMKQQVLPWRWNNNAHLVRMTDSSKMVTMRQQVLKRS